MAADAAQIGDCEQVLNAGLDGVSDVGGNLAKRIVLPRSRFIVSVRAVVVASLVTARRRCSISISGRFKRVSRCR